METYTTDWQPQAEMAYDGLGNRLEMTGYAGGQSVTTQYTLDNGKVLTAAAGELTTNYLYGLGPIAELTDSWSYSLPDGSNTPRQLVNDSGEVTLLTSYTPWGDTLSVSGTGSFTQGYFGGIMDTATGLLYVGNGQYYDPETGRFLNRNAKPEQNNPYIPWGGNPSSALIAPLALLVLVFGRKKTRSRWDNLVIVAVLCMAVGMSLAGCVQPPEVTATLTQPSDHSLTAEVAVSGTATPIFKETIPPTLAPTLCCPEVTATLTPMPTETPTPTPTPTTLAKLATYGVQLTSNPDTTWEEVDALAVLNAVEAVAGKFAFQSVYGPLNFHKVVSFPYAGSTITDGACACGDRHNVTVARLVRKGDVRTEQVAQDQNRNNIVHELGHLFSYHWETDIPNPNPGTGSRPTIPNPNHPYNMFSEKLLRDDVGWPPHPDGSDLMWRQHPSRMDNGTFYRGEVFADMFLGWVFGVYATDDIGKLRQSEMERIMRTKLGEL